MSETITVPTKPADPGVDYDRRMVRIFAALGLHYKPASEIAQRVHFPQAEVVAKLRVLRDHDLAYFGESGQGWCLGNLTAWKLVRAVNGSQARYGPLLGVAHEDLR